jgi:hypothetical protein
MKSKLGHAQCGLPPPRAPDRITTFLRIGVTGHTLTGAYKTARSVSKLKTGDERLGAALTKNALRLERMGDVLENLHRTEEEITRARAFADISPQQGASRVQNERQ